MFYSILNSFHHLRVWSKLISGRVEFKTDNFRDLFKFQVAFDFGESIDQQSNKVNQFDILHLFSRKYQSISIDQNQFCESRKWLLSLQGQQEKELLSLVRKLMQVMDLIETSLPLSSHEDLSDYTIADILHKHNAPLGNVLKGFEMEKLNNLKNLCLFVEKKIIGKGLLIPCTKAKFSGTKK